MRYESVKELPVRRNVSKRGIMKPLIVLTTLFFVSIGCSPTPSREKFPGPPGRTTDFRQAEVQQAVMGGIDSLNNPLAPKSTTASDSKAKIQGTIQIAKGQTALGKYLFIALRPASGGPPLAVKRIEDPKFPFEFELSESDAMMPGTVFEGDVELSVKLLQESNPLSQTPGDLSARFPVKIGGPSLKVELKQ